MRRAVEQTGTPSRLVRIDHDVGDDEISQEILKEIDKADIPIADFTLDSPDVDFDSATRAGRADARSR